jgi:23S rRNA (uracil1939-C5)-methyltransferase
MGRRKKPKLIENLTVGPADKGRSVAKNDLGDIVFLDGVAPGDVVDALILRKRKGVMEGIVQGFKSYSEDRVDPFCKHFGVCGGCKWQHISYEAQLKHKTNIVENAMKRIAKVEIEEFLPIVPADKTDYYRNKLEYSFSNKRWLEADEIANADISNKQDVFGFHRPKTFDKIIDIDHCYLQPEPSNLIRNFVREKAKEMGLEFMDIRAVSGYLRNMIVRTTTLGETMIVLSVFKEDEKARIELLDAMWKEFPYISSLNYAINYKRNDTLYDIDIVNYKGRPYIEEELKGIRYRISPKSFFQTNSAQAVKLYDKVVEFAGFTGEENVYDLYTGTGSIACYVAQYCKQVVGIEEVEAAIEDAAINANINNIENSVFYAGDVKDILTDEFADKHGKPDILITDPPRAGMHPKVVAMLLKLASPKIVYVSCNPATQARDLNLLSEKYDVIKVQPVDMFPHTHHIESVALLELRTDVAELAVIEDE